MQMVTTINGVTLVSAIYQGKAILRTKDVEVLLNTSNFVLRSRIKKLEGEGNWQENEDFFVIPYEKANKIFECSAYTTPIYGFTKQGFEKLASLTVGIDAVREVLIKFYDETETGERLEFIDEKQPPENEPILRQPRPVPPPPMPPRVFRDRDRFQQIGRERVAEGVFRKAKSRSDALVNLAGMTDDEDVKNILLLLAGIELLDSDTADKKQTVKTLMKTAAVSLKKKQAKKLIALICSMET